MHQVKTLDDVDYIPTQNLNLCFGKASLSGSKLQPQVPNRASHNICYTEAKGLETEFAFLQESDINELPDGILPNPDLGTATVWDNNDANVETLNGKGTCIRIWGLHIKTK